MRKTVFYEHIAEASIQTGQTIPELLEKVKSYGIGGVEIEDRRLYKQVSLVHQLKDAGIEIGCIYGFLNYQEDDNRQDGRKLVDLASSLHVHNILVIPGFVTPELLNASEKLSYQREVMRMIEYVCDLTDYAEQKGIVTGMEDFDDKIAPYSTICGLRKFAEKIPKLKVTFDTGNFLYSEEDILEAYEELSSYVGYVHLKDRSFDPKDGEIPKVTLKGRNLYSSPVGHGVIPMHEFLSRLKRSGYDGTLAIEHFGSKHQLEDMRKSAEWIEQIWKEC